MKFKTKYMPKTRRKESGTAKRRRKAAERAASLDHALATGRVRTIEMNAAFAKALPAWQEAYVEAMHSRAEEL